MEAITISLAVAVVGAAFALGWRIATLSAKVDDLTQDVKEVKSDMKQVKRRLGAP